METENKEGNNAGAADCASSSSCLNGAVGGGEVQENNNNKHKESAKNNGNAPTTSAAATRLNAEINNQDQSKIMQKLSKLQVKTKSLRTKLSLGKQELLQKEKAVQQSFKLRDDNDDTAMIAMMNIELKSSRVETTTQPRAIVGGTAAKVTVTKTTAVVEQQQITTEQRIKPRHRKTVRELQQQVDGLKELLSQLTLEKPEMQIHLRQLVQSNPKFKQLDLYPVNNNASNVNGFSRARQDSERTAAASGAKSRHESEVSNIDSMSYDISVYNNTASSSTDNNKKQRERKRGGRNKSNNKSENAVKTQESEQEALAKYINAIVAEYLGGQKELIAEYQFKGGLNELDAYANRLVQAGFGRIVEEEIRINRKNNRQSFITMSADREALVRDGIILIPVARRYAFDGDIVRAFVMNAGLGAAANSIASSTSAGAAAASASANIDEKTKIKEENQVTMMSKDNSFCLGDDEDPFATFECAESLDSDIDPNELDASAITISDNCPKAFVISIIKQNEARQIIGTISFKNVIKLNDEQRSYYKLKPHDLRVPMIYIPEDKMTVQITDNDKNEICGFLYLAQVYETDENGHCIGELLQPVGKVGNLEAEIKAILLHNGFKDLRPYEERFNELFAQPTPPITQEDLQQREDLRSICVFTIDPMTARDLDDAVSVECLGDDQYEIGVHISDLSHYLQEDSELDNIVKNRATSIYLVTEVIHMLPQPLCFKCSLLPGEDKFAFSVFWRLNAKGERLGEPRFTRSVINSCTQFAYEHAQKIIDNPNEQFGVDDFPTIFNGFTPNDISQRVRILHEIAQQLRIKRYDDGAISINNPKLRFNLDPLTGEPVSYEVDGRQDANFLIEEFMLLANQTVAKFIFDRFPNIAILRNHAPPLSKSMKALREKLANFGIEFDYSSSKSVYESMQRICREAKNPKAMDACLNTLLTKPMARAKYFCSEGKTEAMDLWHYALSIPIYTHFTSPIRRYPDVLVHRLLAAALNYGPPPKRTVDELHQITKVCNEQKFNAKSAGDESSNLFFKRYIRSKQSLVLLAVVTEIFQHLINVVIIETGHAIPINYKLQKVIVDSSNVPAFIQISERYSSMPPLKLQLFSTVEVKLVIWDEKVCGFFVSPDLKQRQQNSKDLTRKKQQQLQQLQLTNGPCSSTRNGATKNALMNGIQSNDGCNNRSKSKSKKSAKTNNANNSHNNNNNNNNNSNNNNKKERVYALKDGDKME